MDLCSKYTVNRASSPWASPLCVHQCGSIVMRWRCVALTAPVDCVGHIDHIKYCTQEHYEMQETRVRNIVDSSYVCGFSFEFLFFPLPSESWCNLLNVYSCRFFPPYICCRFFFSRVFCRRQFVFVRSKIDDSRSPVATLIVTYTHKNIH